MKRIILVVDDDVSVLDLVSEVLSEDGFEPRTAKTAAAARDLLKKAKPILVVLDRRLPDADGIELCQEIRQDPHFSSLPILFLTAKSTVADKVAGLRLGGDDYLPKPFSTKELSARVASLLRRAAPEGSALEADGLRMDLDSRKVSLGSREVALSMKEFELLHLLLSHRNKALSRQFILQEVWGYGAGIDVASRVVDVTLGHLRDKLGAWGKKVSSVRGLGYRLDLLS